MAPSLTRGVPLALLLSVVVSAPLGADEEPRAVAVVVESQGENVRTGPGGSEPLRRFDWLAVGEEIRMAEDGAATLAFADGRRFRLGSRAAARLADSGPVEVSGIVEELESVPTLPPLAAASTGNELARPAAVRLRGVRGARLFPDVGARALADAAVLRFVPVEGAERHSIEVEDEDGKVVYRTETADSSVEVPAAVLEADRSYWWSLRSEDAAGRRAGHWTARLRTLPAADARARRQLRDAVGEAPDPTHRALLAEIDCRLGLHVRCLDGLESLVAPDGGRDGDLERRIAELRASLPP